jgi:deazaflavin-dependent oxidoreductase (nitroreductase family)
VVVAAGDWWDGYLIAPILLAHDSGHTAHPVPGPRGHAQSRNSAAIRQFLGWRFGGGWLDALGIELRRHGITAKEDVISDRERVAVEAGFPAEGTEEYKALNREWIAEFRANGGQLGGPFAGVPLLVLITTGAKTGQPRANLVTYSIHDGRLVIVAAKEGDAIRHPDWFYNLRANPGVMVELGAERFAARAVVLRGAERQRLFERIVAEIPPEFAGYLEKTQIEIPVIALDRVA